MIKKYLKCYGYLLGINFILALILSIINYFIPKNYTTIKIIIPIISILISSLILGKNTKEKAYLEGLKYITPYLFLITIIKLIINTGFNYKVIIIYIVYILTSIIGATIGINLKNK